MIHTPAADPVDLRHLRRAIHLALAAEATGNLPIGAGVRVGRGLNAA